MSTNLPYVCPLCGAAMTANVKCPCEKFEQLLAAAKVALNDVKFHYGCPWNYKTRKWQDTAGILALKAIVENEVRK